MDIKENLEKIKSEISECEKISGRNVGSVKLMAVSKFHPSSEIIQAILSAQLLFGENRVQESCEKFSSILEKYNNVSLHLIGQLQTNKVKNIVGLADCIQSVDRLSLIEEIEKQCAKINRNIKILFEFHTAEDSKSGFENEKDIFDALNLLANNKYPHVVPAGFMTMAPFTQDEIAIRKSFIKLRQLKDNMKNEFPELNLDELSMGMSSDFKIAIEEGSTMVRIGTAIFGERDYSK